jgi:hypothetical protein
MTNPYFLKSTLVERINSGYDLITLLFGEMGEIGENRKNGKKPISPTSPVYPIFPFKRY